MTRIVGADTVGELQQLDMLDMSFFFLNGWDMIFWKFQMLEKCPGPIFQKPAKNGV